MKNERTKTGLIGFFDILGYQNLLERNEPETIAEEVLPILTNIDSETMKNLKNLTNAIPMSEANKQLHTKIIETMGWLVFSDTVLMTLPIDGTDQNIVQMSWLAFLGAAIMVQVNLFRAGLPTRGVIEHGKFFIKDTCFAGRTIINAYQLCSQLELAACVFSEIAAKEFRSIEGLRSLYNLLAVEYLIPMKSGEKHLLTLMAHTYNLESPDIHGEVMRAFWRNAKDISISARQKAQNTEQWLEFLKMKDEEATAVG